MFACPLSIEQLKIDTNILYESRSTQSFNSIAFFWFSQNKTKALRKRFKYVVKRNTHTRAHPLVAIGLLFIHSVRLIWSIFKIIFFFCLIYQNCDLGYWVGCFCSWNDVHWHESNTHEKKQNRNYHYNIRRYSRTELYWISGCDKIGHIF